MYHVTTKHKSGILSIWAAGCMVFILGVFIFGCASIKATVKDTPEDRMDAIFSKISAKAETGGTADKQRAAEFQLLLNKLSTTLETHTNAGNQEGIADVYREYGNAYFEQKTYGKSEEYYLKSHEMDIKTGIIENIGRNFYDLGYVNRYLKQYEKAKYFFEKSIEFDRSQGNMEGMVCIYESMESLAVASGNLHEVEGLIKKSLAIQIETDNKKGIITQYESLLDWYIVKPSLRSEQVCLDALKAYNDQGLKEESIKAYSCLHSVYKNQKKEEKAEKSFQKIIDIKMEFGKHDDVVGMYLMLGIAYSATNEKEISCKYFEKSHKFYTDHNLNIEDLPLKGLKDMMKKFGCL